MITRRGYSNAFKDGSVEFTTPRCRCCKSVRMSLNQHRMILRLLGSYRHGSTQRHTAGAHELPQDRIGLY